MFGCMVLCCGYDTSSIAYSGLLISNVISN
nr:MAG TPA: hypothetical protein [Caudoviricetes sp.]